jgi:xylan 1,4-beta-xylosidase
MKFCFLAFCGLVAFQFLRAQSDVVPPALPDIPNRVFPVKDFGAIGDDRADNTVAVQKAIDAAERAGGGKVVVPAGIYLCGPLQLGSRLDLQIDSGAIMKLLPIDKYPGGVTTGTDFISGSNLHDVAITGKGTIDGQGSPWWPYAKVKGARRPRMIALKGCSKVLIENVTLTNSPMFHIAISGKSSDVTVSGVIVRAPASDDPVNSSHNTDACDVSGSHILIKNCDISTGDDDFTCGGGTSNVHITGCKYGYGHGLSIGSYTRGGVDSFLIENCTFNNTEAGIRIKSDRGRGGVVQNLTYRNLRMTNVGIPILIYGAYMAPEREYRDLQKLTPEIAAGYPAAAVTDLTPVYKNIRFENIIATVQPGKRAGLIWGLPEAPASGIVLKNVDITADKPFGVFYAEDVRLENCVIKSRGGRNKLELTHATAFIDGKEIAEGGSRMGRSGDLGDGTFLNPILGGDHPDPTIMRDGKDYYMTNSAFDYVPGLTILHSTDLVNWEPISYALTTYLGSGWAPDLCKYKGKYYIYFTVAGASRSNYVVYASSPYGPWSAPVDLKLGGIDPCHVVDESGQRWLFLSGGNRVKLSADGLKTVGAVEKVYSGWQFPESWVTEGFSLEGPKLRKIGDYYYWLSAEGGTAGPPTSHMVVVARSKSIDGPWENAPENPLVHTYSASEKWWSKGHGSLIDASDGRWWIVYHAYENGFLNLGRQTLLEPLELTKDGWFKAPTGTGVENPLPMPVRSGGRMDRLAKLGEFRIGLDWRYYKKYDPGRASVSNGVLTLKAQGKTPHESGPLLFVPGVHNYELSVKIDKDPGAAAGLVLFYNADFYVGTTFDSKARYRWRKGATKWRAPQNGGNELWLKLKLYDNIVTGYYSDDGTVWKKEPWGMDVSGYDHNTLYDFLSVLPGVVAYGEGSVRFSDLRFEQL